MKKLIFAATLSFMVAFSTQSQNNGPNPEEFVKRQTEQMVKDLDLNEKQTKQVSDLNAKFAEQMKKARDENQGDRDKMRASMKKMRDDRNTELKKILTDEQYKKHLELQEKRMKERGKRGGGGPR